MPYGLFADLVGVLHLAFVAFTVCGGLLVFRWPWVMWLHLPAAIWGAAIEISGGVCPLTPLENSLRLAAGREAYEGDFVGHHVMSILYPPGLTPGMQLALGAFVIVLNAGVYAVILRRRIDVKNVKG